MQSPWGELRVFDAHVHFFSHRFFASLAEQAGKPTDSLGETLGLELPGAEPKRLAATWAAELARHGVERSVLIASVPGDEDSVASAVHAFPNRFTGYFMLDPSAPDAAERARRAVAECGLRGICLFPAMHRYSIQDPCLEPVFELAQSRQGVIVFVHCGVLTVGIRAKLGLPSRFDMRFSNPLDLHAVALRYPTVPFVIPHFGAGYFREALMVADLCPNVYLDTSSSNGWVKYQEAGCNLESVFRRALAVLGPNRLLFGTDSSFFPRGWCRPVFDSQVDALSRIGLEAAASTEIFGGNLERLLNL